MRARFATVVGVVSLLLVSGRASAQPRPAVKSAPREQAWLFSYTASVTGIGRPGAGTSVTFDVAVRNGVARVTAGGGAFATLSGARGALLVRAGDTLISAINPDKREVLVLAASQLGTLLGGPVPDGLQFDVSEVSSTIRRGGAGPRIEGHASRHVTLEQRYTLTIGMNAMRRVIRTQQQVEVDVSSSLSRLDRGFDAFIGQVVSNSGTPASVLAVLRPLQRTMPSGFPRRSGTAAVVISGSDTLRTRSESAISRLRREVVDTMTFRIPHDFRVTELSRLLQPRRPM